MEPFEVAEHPVGLDQAAEDFQNEILKRGNPDTTMILGIAGMSGIGKSTLATHLYKLRRSDFRRSSFLSDVSKTDLRSLQGKLFRDLLGQGFQIYNPREWRRILRDRLLGLRVLIVLDDVDHIDQINSLLVPGAVGSGSLILITSRDKDLLRRSSVKTLVYDVKPVQAKYSRELFCWHAFGQSEPSEGFEDLVDGFLKICGGLPLSLKVMGGQFIGRCDKEYWKRQLEKICTTLRPDDIIDRLKVSYETLNTEEKKIFLDMGCFFVGEDKELAFRVFEGLGCSNVRDCLQILHKKCLVDFQELSVNESEEIKFPINLRRQIGTSILNRTIIDDDRAVSVMSFLRDLTLKRTSISELCIPQSACPSLETLDLSENIQLIRVEGLPSTLVSLNLEGCSTLEKLMVHSKLVNLKFVNINRCHELETLDVEGLRSLEEIRADPCWKLQRIEALIQQERLNCLHISTDDAVIWNGICEFLTSPPQLATAAFSRKVDGDMINDEKIATWIIDFEHVTVLDAPQLYTSSLLLKNIKNIISHGAILMCFITSSPTQSFSVQFYGSGDLSNVNLYQTAGEGRRLHVFMWTEDSKLFEDGSTDAYVNCSQVDGNVNEPCVKNGWILILKSKTEASKLCKQILSTVK